MAEPETEELRRKFRTMWNITFGTGKRGYWICAAVTHDGRPCISPSVWIPQPDGNLRRSQSMWAEEIRRELENLVLGRRRTALFGT